MAKKTTPKATPKAQRPERLLALLSGVPTQAFAKMAAASGLPAMQAREMCRLFMELKK